MSDVVADIKQCVAHARANGHVFMILAIAGRAKRTGKRAAERVRVAPGLLGSLRNEQERSDGLIDLVVEVLRSDAEAWLKRRGVAP